MVKSHPTLNHDPESMPCCVDLWFTKISNATIDYENQTEKLLSETEAKRLTVTTSKDKRREFLLSRALMRHALSHKYDITESYWAFLEQADIAPNITNLPYPAYMSLSHSKGFICFAISNYSLGIDIETINIKRDLTGIAKEIMSNDEIAYLNQSPDNYQIRFYELWCSKEAYYKSLSTVEQTNIDLSKISLKSVNKGENAKQILLNNLENLLLSIAIDSTPDKINQFYFPSYDCLGDLTSELQDRSHYYKFADRL